MSKNKTLVLVRENDDLMLKVLKNNKLYILDKIRRK